MCEFFNDKLESSYVTCVNMTPTKKISADFFDRLQNQRWRVQATWRGKETRITFFGDVQKHDMILHHFKAGFFRHYESIEEAQKDHEFVNHHRFHFVTSENEIFAHIDTYNQSYWRWATEWGTYRSPDIIVENNAWRKNLYNLRKRKYMDQPVFELMMHPRLFNGLNNFSISEILCRASFPPWTTLKEILEEEEMREELFRLTEDVLQDIYLLGGMQLGQWENPFGCSADNLKAWIRVYHVKFSGHFLIKGRGDKMLWTDRKWKRKWEIRNSSETRLHRLIYSSK